LPGQSHQPRRLSYRELSEELEEWKHNLSFEVTSDRIYTGVRPDGRLKATAIRWFVHLLFEIVGIPPFMHMVLFIIRLVRSIGDVDWVVAGSVHLNSQQLYPGSESVMSSYPTNIEVESR
jgi:hypothetical protein